MLSRKLCKVHLNLDDDKLCDIDFMGAKVRGFRMDFYQADDMIRKMEQFVLDHSKLSLEQLMESDFSMLERETLISIARNNGEFLPNRLVNCLHLTSLCCYLPSNGYEFGMAPLMNNKLFCLLFVNFWFDSKDELKNYWMQLENAFPEDDAEIYKQFQKDLCYYISFRFYPSLDHIFSKHYLQGMSVAMESLQQFYRRFPKLCDIDDFYVSVREFKACSDEDDDEESDEDEEDSFDKKDDLGDFFEGIEEARECFTKEKRKSKKEKAYDEMVSNFDRDFLLSQDRLDENVIAVRNHDRSSLYYNPPPYIPVTELPKMQDKDRPRFHSFKFEDDYKGQGFISNKDDIQRLNQYVAEYSHRELSEFENGSKDNNNDDDDDDDDDDDANSVDSQRPRFITEKQNPDLVGIIIKKSDDMHPAQNRARWLMRHSKELVSEMNQYVNKRTDNTAHADGYYLTLDKIGLRHTAVENHTSLYKQEDDDDDDDNDDDDNNNQNSNLLTAQRLVQFNRQNDDNGSVNSRDSKSSKRSKTSNTATEDSYAPSDSGTASSFDELFASVDVENLTLDEEFMKKYKVTHINYCIIFKLNIVSRVLPRYDPIYMWKDRHTVRRLHLIVMLLPYIYKHKLYHMVYEVLSKFNRFAIYYPELTLNNIFGVIIYLQFCTDCQLALIMDMLEAHRREIAEAYEYIRDTILDDN